jgi:hypothetical protein
MKKINFLALSCAILFGSAFAVSGDSVTITKSGLSKVSSLSVSSGNNYYYEYVKETANSSSNVSCRAYGRNNINLDYNNIPGTKLTVDKHDSDYMYFNSSYSFVRIELSGLGKGIGTLTAK